MIRTLPRGVYFFALTNKNNNPILPPTPSKKIHKGIIPCFDKRPPLPPPQREKNALGYYY
jgi:hypothetical protein